MSIIDSPEIAVLLGNIKTFSEIFNQDPEVIQDVKSNIEKQIPELQDQESNIFRSIGNVKPNIEAIERHPDITAMIRSNSNINMVISPEYIRRPPKDLRGKRDLFFSNLAQTSGEMNYSFGMRYNDAAKVLFQYIAIPSYDPTSNYLIYEILEESKEKLLNAIKDPFTDILLGCEPQCTATAVYNKISPFVVWELVWDLRHPEYLTYIQELDGLMLHKDIPIIGAGCGEVFLSLVTDREIPRSDDDNENMEKLLAKLNLTEERIRECGFLINPITKSINLVPYPCRELASMGLFVKHNGEIKSFEQVLGDLTKITNEQFITDSQLQNKKQVLDSLLKSFIHRIRHPGDNIFMEYQNIVSVKDLAKEYSIARADIIKRRGSNQ